MSNIQATNNALNDEINLVELVETLWQGKVTIALCTVVFTLCAIFYALTAQQWWTSKALITVGQYQNTTNIRSQLTNLYAVIDDYSEINKIFSSESLLNDYITEFNSFDNKKTFIENNTAMKQYIDENKLSDEGKLIFITNWVKRISALQLDKTTQFDTYQLSFESTSSKLAHDLLVTYSEYISSKVHNEVFNELDDYIIYNKQILQANKLVLTSRAKQQLTNELVKTNYALDMAKAANVTKPLVNMNMNNNNLFNIELGTEALIEKSKILNKMKNISLFEPKLNIVYSKLELLSKIKLDDNVTLQSVRYLQNANYPTSRDKPRRISIVIIGVIFGVIFGSFFVIFRRLWNKEKLSK
ncbi:LPS O-antigen chain length determinant protein WzzB [Photobacterium phosphoreum]|uniref:LPS O-antigen chain length determinant protein WzzB n=1 Tax=Photobacterium phosphoreum TaxID=659 RepID=UPI001E5CB22F|nr:Wzz/FepE/Etk N-terminal domain-containing protein [Photobacterium phosphoreum]MCD9511824.1 chain-length determining protein [Photobacterium phosphoreum]